MTLSLKRRSLSKPTKGARIHTYDLSAVRARNKNKAHSYLLDIFEESGLSKAEIARMVGKKPEQITRWLSGPGNLTIDTLSDLIFVMKGQTFILQTKDDLSKGKSNRQMPEWLQTIEPSKWLKVNYEEPGGGIKKNVHKYIIHSSPHKEASYEQFRANADKKIIEVA